jgi:hypothetical protein
MTATTASLIPSPIRDAPERVLAYATPDEAVDYEITPPEERDGHVYQSRFATGSTLAPTKTANWTSSRSVTCWRGAGTLRRSGLSMTCKRCVRTSRTRNAARSSGSATGTPTRGSASTGTSSRRRLMTCSRQPASEPAVDGFQCRRHSLRGTTLARRALMAAMNLVRISSNSAKDRGP